MELKVMRLSEFARLPSYAHPGDAGLDLFAAEEAVLNARAFQLIRTGISLELPEATEAQVRPRSGLALKHGITVLNSPGTIDEGYRGEVGVILINHSDIAFEIKVGMKIAQLVIQRVVSVVISETAFLSSSSRGSGGFGSTGH